MKDSFARTRRMHLHLGSVDTALIEKIAGLLPLTEVAEGSSAHEVTITFDRFRFTAGQIVSAVLEVAEVGELHLDEPAIEDVVRKVYAGELLR
jgi:ABC-2 type transport system ATP-binding protein